MRKIPKRIKVILSETPTIFLLDFASSTELFGTEKGNAAEEDNKLYDFLTSPKGLNRKQCTVGTQTHQILLKTRHTTPESYAYAEVGSFTSNWKMYDTYEAAGRKIEYSYEIKYDSDDEIEDQILKQIKNHPLIDPIEIKPKPTTEYLENNSNFFEACLIIERLIANNHYNHVQKRYKGLLEPDLFRENIQFRYNLKLLWTFGNFETRGRCINAISLNPTTDEIIAVGYGKYYYTDWKKTGIVMIWSIKNPKQPEREYYFESSVTSLEFSRQNPNLLAIGFYNGHIEIIDVSQRDLITLRAHASTNFEPVLKLVWFEEINAKTNKMEEKLLASFGNGAVYKLRLVYSPDLDYLQIFQTNRTDGRLKNNETLGLFIGNESDSYRYTPAMTLTLHSIDPYTYFVGTGEGIIHKCSLIGSDHFGMFKAHNGRINAIKWSPFANKLYLTCGDDFRACLWADCYDFPILTSQYTLEPVLDIEWSPEHATIFVSVRGDDIIIWDLQRKVHQPQSVHKSPTGSTNTIVKFTKSGRCLLVGDLDGHLHVFVMEDMPIAAFFQEFALEQALKRVLVNQPEIMEGIGRLNYPPKQFPRFFTACLWADCYDFPILTSQYTLEPVLDIDRSPEHATIFVSVRGDDIIIWDLQRKVHQPQSVHKSPTGSTNTIVKFTKSGRCLLVGDLDGYLHVFAMEDMPIAAFFQEFALEQALKRILVNQPEIMEGIGRLNYPPKQFPRFFTACLWADCYDFPILTSQYTLEPVLDIDRSPEPATIFVSVRSDDIIIWDLQRKEHQPQSVHKSPTGSTNTIVKFTKSGRCFLVGNLDCHLHVFVMFWLISRKSWKASDVSTIRQNSFLGFLRKKMSSFIRGEHQSKKSIEFSKSRLLVGKLPPPKNAKPIYRQGRASFCMPVYLHGLDVTPNMLDPYVYEGVKERQLNATESKETNSNRSSVNFLATLAQQNLEDAQTINPRMSFLTNTNVEDFVMEDMKAGEGSTFIDQDDKSSVSSTSTSMKLMPAIPKHLSLILAETSTDFVLEIPSRTVIKTGEEGDLVEEDNRAYDYITKGKGRYRKVIEMGIQTLPILRKARDTEVVKQRHMNKATYVSIWEMYDTFEGIRGEGEESDDDIIDDDQPVMNSGAGHSLIDASINSYWTSSEEKLMIKLVRNKRFLDALLVIERILANNCYNTEQKIYKGLADPDPLRKDQEFQYKLRHLWNFSNDDTAGKCITCITLNAANEDIVAAGYGKYFFSDTTSKGMVMLWNIKNPIQAERKYDFKHPVTALDFSKKNPNLLAVGFYNGDLKMLDVSYRRIVVFRDGSEGSFEPLWCLVWFEQGEEEFLMASFGNGTVYRYQIGDSFDLKRIQIMETFKAHGNLKGITYFKRCTGKGVNLSRTTDAICLAFHPVDPFTYYIGTGEGVVHKCSTNYYNQHMDMFLAHKGPLYQMKFAPFANKIYVTCSDDFTSRFWMDGITEPLITSFASIQSCIEVDWSPRHPTIYASIHGNDIYVWDMQRKMFQSQSITKSPNKDKFTVLKFTKSGRCVIAGDIEGNINVFALEDTPIAPFYPENLMMQSLKKVLNTNPDLLHKIGKLGSLNFDKSTFTKYFNK